ncbi:hypothetical protein ZWY2020_001401, partial [Hordeum vulgare]
VVKNTDEAGWREFKPHTTLVGRPTSRPHNNTLRYKFEELAQTHPDMLFLFADVDDVLDASSKLGVKAMPTFFLIKGKEVVKKIVG